MDHDQRIELEEIEKSNRIDYNIDRERTRQSMALEVLMPIIDAGVDIMAMEGAAKNGGEHATIEGQFVLRRELVDGIMAAFKVFGVDDDDVYEAMEAVRRSGFRFKQDVEDIADRLTVFDRLSLINLLYGPRLAGVILTAIEQNSQDNGR